MSSKFFFPLLAFLCLVAAGRLFGQSISTVTPNIGAAGDQVVVSGSGFATPPIKIYFWSGKQAAITITGDGTLYATVPAGATTGPISVQRGTGNINYEGSNFVVIGTGPCITGFSPTAGSVGDYVVISGVHFAGVATNGVKFNGTRSSDAGVINDSKTEVGVYVPTGATSGLISVTTSIGTSNSTTPFTVYGPGPYVTSFSPWSGNVGDTVTLTGVHFAGTTGVKFGSVKAAFNTPTMDTSLTTFVPTGASSGPITVSNASGYFTTATNFYMLPQISSFSPPNGRPGTNVTINGKSFFGATAVSFNGLVVTIPSNQVNTTIQVTVPNSATNGPIQVTAPAGQSPPSSSFVVLPTITGFTPAIGNIGASVTITGQNFFGATNVLFNNSTKPSTVSGVTYGQLTATVPADATTGPITVMTTNGTTVSGTNFFLPARVMSFTPTNSAAGTTITISGSNFLGASAVNFNGTPAASFTPPSNDLAIQAVVPGGVTTGPISVTTPYGTTNSGSLYFYGAPAITSFNPSSGVPGTNVTILGVNLFGATSVLFSNLNPTVPSVINNGKITVIVPSGAHTGPLTVIAPGGTFTTSTNFVLNYTSEISVDISASPDPVFVTSNLVYTLYVENNSGFDAPNVVMTNTLPASVTLKSATTTQGTLVTNANPITGALGTIPVGNEAIITLTVVPQLAGTITNSLSAASDNPDPDPSDNSESVGTTVWPLPTLSIQDLPPNQIRVFWPAPLSNFTLQSSSVITPNVQWTNDPSARTVTLTNVFVTETNIGTTMFYRLTN
jgi:hypothetical protein